MNNLEEIVKAAKEAQEANQKGKMPVELKGFNWGAFILTFIWGIPHKAWITLIAIPLIIIQLPLGLNWLMLTAFQIYCGIKGNEWAYENDYKLTNAQFKTKQMRWGCFSMCLSAMVPILFMLIIMKFMQKGQDNIDELMQNTQCVLTQKYLKKNMMYTPLVMSTTAEQFAHDFAKRDKEAISIGNEVLYGKALNSQRINIFKITFYKGDYSICNIDKQNCRAEGTFTLPEELFEFDNCVFYFNDKKEFIPDEYTQRALFKGWNIFKYL